MLREQVDLQPYNTLALHARAAYFCEPNDHDELIAALAMAREKKLPVLPLGEGSNVVLTRDYPGLVLRLLDARIQLEGSKRESQNDNTVTVRVGAGLRWHTWVEKSLEAGWYGMENLALIPGAVGAAPVQNIGAYGVEIAKFIVSVRGVYIDSGKVFELDNAACQFAYRNSIFKHALAHKTIITSVVFRLSTTPVVHAEYAALREYLAEHHAAELHANTMTPLQVKDAVCEVRRTRLPDPNVLPNAGSFFKNPQISVEHFERLRASYPGIAFYPGENGQIKIAAAWLIDRLGWKGRCIGPACVHDRQALVLVNSNGACGKDILALADAIASDVYKHFDIALENEPWVW
ncbi:MAG TPA: UDP-N-acetylmuramate dehydrogenase [Pseudomonadales bacterium]|nr:UDP-N-acetylmuramate dehydrogenase [Pseudomonadales bacterium]